MAVCSCSFFSLDSGDLLEATRIKEVPLGIVKTRGFCDSRVQQLNLELDEDPLTLTETGNGSLPTSPDVAYTLSLRAVLSVNTAQLFPGKLIYKYGCPSCLTNCGPSHRRTGVISNCKIDQSVTMSSST